VRDFLERLRPSGTPGAATVSAVPADRVGERSAEIEPVLARLAAVQAQGAAIRQAAEVEAQQRKDAAAEQARALVATAHREAEAERQMVAATTRARAEKESRDLLADATQEASAVARAAGARQSSFADRVLTRARADIADIIGSAP
jgi:vacuolar-type H+-ATPase subunit H